MKVAQKTNAQTEQWQQDEKMGRTIGLSISRIEQCSVYRDRCQDNKLVRSRPRQKVDSNTGWWLPPQSFLHAFSPLDPGQPHDPHTGNGI